MKKDSPSLARLRRTGATTIGGLALTLTIIGGVVLVARQVIGDDELADESNVAPASTVVIGTDTAPQSAPSADQAIGTMTVRDASGKRVPLATKGQPAIVMVSSVSCAWCKRSLKDLGELAQGRPLPRLKLLTLEGAADGAPMLAAEHIGGAQLIGPAGSSDQVLLTFRFNGTPTFVAIDRNGRVVSTMPGYPIRDVMKRWFAVMVGDADVP